MVWITDTLWCDGCGVEILGAPVRLHHRSYCCEDCAHGRACDCADLLNEDERRKVGQDRLVPEGNYLIDD
ncbi:MAG TPA: hypothetical protein VIO36_13815 [Anaerolineaceae bacterium]|jgi:hypothetical protein